MSMSNKITKILRKCSVTGNLEYVGSDGMTKAERKNHEEIKKQWASVEKELPEIEAVTKTKEMTI